MSGGEHYERQKARSNVKALILAVMGIGYDEKSAVEITECLIEDAERDGIDTGRLWAALEKVAPLPKDV